MDDMNGLLRNVVRFTSFFLSLCLLAWAFVPESRPFAMGLAVGAVTSLASSIYLGWKVKRIAEFAAGTGRKTGIGFWTRAALALLVVMLAMRAPEINLYAVMSGFLFAPLASLVLVIIMSRKNQS